MSYNKTTWATGDIVTAEKLNNIENGIANNNIYMVTVISNVDEDTGAETVTFDKTWQEIFDAAQSGKSVKFTQITTEEQFGTEELFHEILYTDLTMISYGPEWIVEEEKYISSYKIGLDFSGPVLATFKTFDPNDYPIMEDQK